MRNSAALCQLTPAPFARGKPRDTVDAFLAAASAHADRPAIVEGATVTSYRDFEAKVRRLAGLFVAREEPRVLIALPQGADAYATILAAGLAGGFHTPLNMAAPSAKLERIAGLLAPDFIIGGGAALEALRAAAPDAQVLDPTALPDGAPLAGRGTRHRLAYVLFTSGSTGLPKGVAVPRNALDHYVDWVSQNFDMRSDDRVAQHPNLAFDISMTDIFAALCHGAVLVPLCTNFDRMMPARFISREKITVWNSTPSVVSLMMQANEVTSANLASLRLMNFCGEPLLREQLAAVFSARSDLRVQNTYGPTEATVSMTCLPLTADGYEVECAASVALGDAIPGMDVVLAGGAHSDEGEIVITGPQLAEGYWNDEVKTAAVFRTVATPTGPQRGYWTGDWAERREGKLFFKERIDFQVKVRGFRVELDEVAAAIRDCGWPVAVCFKRGEALAAVVEEMPDRKFDESALRAALAKKIESHAVPAAIVALPRMPRNDNDKLDRKAAAAMFEDVLRAMATSPAA